MCKKCKLELPEGGRLFVCPKCKSCGNMKRGYCVTGRERPVPETHNPETEEEEAEDAGAERRAAFDGVPKAIQRGTLLSVDSIVSYHDNNWRCNASEICLYITASNSVRNVPIL